MVQQNNQDYSSGPDPLQCRYLPFTFTATNSWPQRHKVCTFTPQYGDTEWTNGYGHESGHVCKTTNHKLWTWVRPCMLEHDGTCIFLLRGMTRTHQVSIIIQVFIGDMKGERSKMRRKKSYIYYNSYQNFLLLWLISYMYVSSAFWVSWWLSTPWYVWYHGLWS